MKPENKAHKNILVRKVIIAAAIIAVIGVASAFAYQSAKNAGWFESAATSTTNAPPSSTTNTPTSATTNTPTSATTDPQTTDTEKSDFKIYKSTDGWTIDYPSSWDKVEQDYIQEESTGKTVVFFSKGCSKEELESWIESEIKRKLEATEADNTLAQTLKKEQSGNLLVYSYTINSKMDGSEWLLKNTIFYDGKMRYEFRTQLPPITEKEYGEIIKSFKIISNTAETTVSTETITVKTVEELFEAIGPNRIIQLQPGTYRLDELTDLNLVNPYAAMQTERDEQSLDGAELVIQDVENLTITGLGESQVEIFTKYQLANVLTFENAKNIIITNIRAGHSPSQGGCYGGVITFRDSENISIRNSSFFGCGINGLELCNVKNVLLDDSVIEDCSFHIMCLSNSEDIIFQNSKFINNRGTTLLNISGCRDVVFDGCELSDNAAVTDIGVFFTIDFFDFSAYVSSFERNDVTSNVTVKNSVIKNNSSMSTDIMRTPNESKDSITFENTVFEGNGFDK